MHIKKTPIKDLVLLKTKIHRDSRGFLKETSKKNVIKKDFIFDLMSSSNKNVLRGLHIQTKKPQAKLITVSYGEIFDVAVDLRKKSKTFGKHFSIIMSDKSDFSLYIPEGFAHGFICLSKTCIINYKCNKYRDAKSETTLRWDDSHLKIKWPVKKPILPLKDKHGKNLNYFK